MVNTIMAHQVTLGAMTQDCEPLGTNSCRTRQVLYYHRDIM